MKKNESINNYLVLSVILIQIVIMNYIFYTKDIVIHPYTINQISFAKNNDFKNFFLSDDIYKINKSEINFFLENNYQKGLYYYFKKTQTPERADAGIHGGEWGYSLVIKIFLNIFPGPDFIKIIIFHFLIHSLIYLIIVKKMKKNTSILFTLFYTLNPIVIYFIAYPNYYFLQSVAGFIVLNRYLNSNKLKYYLLDLIVLSFLFIVRSTIVGFIAAYLFIILFKYKKILFFNLCIVFVSILLIVLSILLPSKNFKRILHTIAIGQNAYKFSSEEIYMRDDYIQDIINKKIKDEKIKSNCWKVDRCGQSDELYLNLLGTYLLNEFNDNPNVFFVNLIKNQFLLFSPGYKSDNFLLINLSIFIGFFVLLISIFYRKFFLIFLILISEITFSLYYPPIVAYRFGSLIILIYLGVIILEKLINKFFSNQIKI